MASPTWNLSLKCLHVSQKSSLEYVLCSLFSKNTEWMKHKNLIHILTLICHLAYELAILQNKITSANHGSFGEICRFFTAPNFFAVAARCGNVRHSSWYTAVWRARWGTLQVYKNWHKKSEIWGEKVGSGARIGRIYENPVTLQHDFWSILNPWFSPDISKSTWFFHSCRFSLKKNGRRECRWSKIKSIQFS